MSGPRPLLLALALLSASLTLAAAQPEIDARALAQKARSMKGMAGAPPHVIVIGDSHTEGPFGHELGARLRAAYPGWRIETYASCGAAPNWYLPGSAASGHTSPCGTWFHRYSAENPSKLEDVTTASPTPLIGALLGSRPDTVIVALGTNMADWKKGGLIGMDTASALARAITGAGARCLWVGPPDGIGQLTREQATAQIAQLNAALPKALGGACVYLQSHTTYAGTDPQKLHYPPGPAKVWAGQAAAAVQGALGGGIPDAVRPP
jgi:hypothetical protein